MTGINKGERTELKSIVRSQFKVLRAELDQREIEMRAEVEDQIAAKNVAADEKWEVLQHEIHEAVLACNRAVNDAIYKHGYEAKGPTERVWISEPKMSAPNGMAHEQQVRQNAVMRIRAQVNDARLRLDRQEADLLKTLAVGALESDEAQSFLGQIPTIGQLVPSARLAELEASLDGETK